MALSLEELREEILALPTEARRDLATSIFYSLEETDPELGLHPAWIPELERRSEEFRAGKVKGIPAEEFFAEMDRLIHRQ